MVHSFSAGRLPSPVQKQIVGFTPLQSVAVWRAASSDSRIQAEVCLASLDGLCSIMREMIAIDPYACDCVCVDEDKANFIQQLASTHFPQRPGETAIPFGPLSGALLTQLFQLRTEHHSVKHIVAAADVDAQALESLASIRGIEDDVHFDITEEMAVLKALLCAWRWVAHCLLGSYTFTVWYVERQMSDIDNANRLQASILLWERRA